MSMASHHQVGRGERGRDPAEGESDMSVVHSSICVCAWAEDLSSRQEVSR